MKITVKLLLGPERVYEVLPSMSIGDLKKCVEKDFNIGITNQKLLYNGRTLLETEKTLGDYNVIDGGRITVFTSKAHPDTPTPSCSSVNRETVPELPSPGSTWIDQEEDLLLHDALVKVFKQYYSLIDCERVVDEFMRDFKAKIALLSLDDIERLAGQYLQTNFHHPSE